MPTIKQIEAGAKALFERSLYFETGCYHWPGDEPRHIMDVNLRESGLLKTISVDSEAATHQGGLSDVFRAQARLVLEAAEAATCEAS
jgi:hypothetical protein